MNESSRLDSKFLEYRRKIHSLPVKLVTCSKLAQTVIREEFGRDALYVRSAVKSPGLDRRKSYETNGAFRVLMVASDHLEDKGLRYAVPALQELKRRLGCQPVWVSPDEPALFRNTGFETHVNLNREQLGAVYRSCDVLVYTPLVDGVGFPPIEAMGMGVPVVVTLNGGSDEYAIHEGNCLVVPIRDTDAIVRAVTRLYHDSELRTRLGQRGAQTARMFSPEIVLPELAREIERLFPMYCSDVE